MLASGVQIAHPGKASITKPSLDPFGHLELTLTSHEQLLTQLHELHVILVASHMHNMYPYVAETY